MPDHRSHRTRSRSPRFRSAVSCGRFALLGLLSLLLGTITADLSHAQAPPMPRSARKGLANADAVTRGMELREGFFRIYHTKGKMYLEIPRRSLKKPFFLATSFAGGNSFHGWQWSDQLVHWERFEDKLLLVEQDLRYRSDPNNPVGDAVRRTYSNRIVLALPIIGEGKGGNRGYLIDGKRMLADNAPKFFGAMAGRLNASLARFDKRKSFPHNCEIAVTMPTRSDGKLTTLHYSLARLPNTNYKPREADPRIGYFLTAFKDFSKGRPEDARFVRYINRWNLVKKDRSLAISPPVKPIVFYIEKTVPIRYRRAIREGILEWNKAFEKVGFYNAVEVRQQTNTEFADLDPEDSRYNFFRWITSESAFAMGPSRVNPRTGEILDADVIFDDSMARAFLAEYDRLLADLPETYFSPRMRQYYRDNPEQHPFAGLQCMHPGHEHSPEETRRVSDPLPTDSAASRAFCRYGEGLTHQLAMAGIAQLALKQKKGKDGEVPDEFVYAVVKETVMHEIGHTLGLRHNFKASNWKTQQEVNEAEYGEATVGSVMDYNPVNVVVDGEQKQFTTGTLGPYDYWAIEYGYATGKKRSDLQAIASRSAEKGLDYGTDDDLFDGDPTIAQFDMGTDPLQFAKQRLDVVRELMPLILDRLVDDGESYQLARRAFDALLYELSGAAVVASRHVGGAYLHRDHKGTPGARPPVEVVPAAKQREALDLIHQHILSPEAMPVSPKLLNYLAAGRWSHWGQGSTPASYPILERIQAIQSLAVATLLNPETLSRIRNNELKVGSEAPKVTIPEVMNKLTEAIFAETTIAEGRALAQLAIAAPRQNLQRFYLNQLIRFTVNQQGGPAIVPALARTQLKDIHDRLSRIRDRSRDPYTIAHVDDSLSRIDRALRAQYQAF